MRLFLLSERSARDNSEPVDKEFVDLL